MTHRRIGRHREDRRGMGLRQPQKTTCASHGDEEKLQQLHESALGKKKFEKRSRQFFLSLSLFLFHPLCLFSISLSIFFSLLTFSSVSYMHSCTLSSYAEYPRAFYLPLSVSPPLLLFLSVSCGPPFLSPCNTFLGEDWVPASAAAGQGC